MKAVYKIGIVGFGSIGNRHFYNIISVLTELDNPFSIDLIRSGRGNELTEEVIEKASNIYTSYNTVPNDYDIIFVTNPTYLHYETIKYFTSKTKHMFIEKPLFDRAFVDLDSLHLNTDSIYYVACPIRYTKVIQYMKKYCDLQHTYAARIICSSYLPDWRPSQDYRKSYSAHIEQGGGVSIDLIHEWDYLIYLFGQPLEVMNIKGKFSDLEIDSDDLSLYLARYPGMAAEVHLDYFGRKNIREIQLFTDSDTIVGDIANGEVRYLQNGDIISLREERNDFYKKELYHFFDIISGKAVNDNDILSALKTLQIAMQAKQNM